MKPRAAVWIAGLLLAWCCAVHAAPADFFRIEVVDEATGRGVPLVRLETTDSVRHYTDSNGLVAFNEPGLMDQDVWFTISSHGYEFPREVFGSRGVLLKPTAGGRAQVRIRRINIAERLYRITGRGIYRDTILLGEKPPIAEGALNGKVMGQDSTLTAIHRGRLYWFWGDTSRPSHPLGNFFMAGATSELPGKGGLDPSVGVNLSYFLDSKSGFARQMVPPPRPGPFPLWLDGLLTVTDDQGQQRLLAHGSRVKGLRTFERSLFLYNDQAERFEELKQIPLDAPLAPAMHPMRATVDGREYYYFSVPFPVIRVSSDWASLTDLSAYEGFTCLKDAAAYAKVDPPLDRDAAGRLVWKWRKNTAPLTVGQIEELVQSRAIRRDETPFDLRDADGGGPLRIHRASVYWNQYRQKWVMIGGQEYGASFIGEIWFAEASAPEGPWVHARKVATHAKKGDNQDLYNPLQHPYFAQENGRLIYFEGTYVNTFSGNPAPTPLYNYNQLMYRLDLSDPRLKLPEAPPGLSNARPSKLGH
jgi:hypothetical protein